MYSPLGLWPIWGILKLLMSVRPSVRACVRPSVCPSVRPSVPHQISETIQWIFTIFGIMLDLYLGMMPVFSEFWKNPRWPTNAIFSVKNKHFDLYFITYLSQNHKISSKYAYWCILSMCWILTLWPYSQGHEMSKYWMKSWNMLYFLKFGFYGCGLYYWYVVKWIMENSEVQSGLTSDLLFKVNSNYQMIYNLTAKPHIEPFWDLVSCWTYIWEWYPSFQNCGKIHDGRLFL